MHNECRLVITNELVRLVKRLADAYSVATGADPAEYYERYYLDLVPHADVIYSVGNGLGITATDRVLEVGSGLGTRCLLGNAIFGAEFVGLEPCANAYSNLKDAISVFREANRHLMYESKHSAGENTGLEDESFDHIVSFEVLEHVQSPIDVITEMFRVLKPSGKIFISSCNYDSIYEGHYRSLLIPTSSKRFQKAYFKLINRNAKFIDEINFITKKQIYACLKISGFVNIKFHDDYAITHFDRLNVQYPDGINTNFGSNNAKLIQKIVQSKPIRNILSMLNREYKINVTAEKPMLSVIR